MNRLLAAASLVIAVSATPAIADTMAPETVVNDTAATVIARMTEKGDPRPCAMYDIKGCREAYAVCVRIAVHKAMPRGRHFMLWQVVRITSDVDSECSTKIVAANPGAAFR